MNPAAQPVPVPGGTPLQRRWVRGIQCGLGALWLFDGILQLQPAMFGQRFVTDVLAPSLDGQPGPVGAVLGVLVRPVSVFPAGWNLVFATVQILIGVGLLFRRTVRPALALSVLWGLGVWALGEGFGMLLTGTASPLTGAPGAVLLYVAIGVLVWPRRSTAAAGSPAGAGTGATSAASAGALGHAGAVALWAVLWFGYALLWLLPANSGAGALGATLRSTAKASPGWLAGVQNAAATSVGTHGTLVALAMALTCAVVGAGPLLARRATPFLVVGAALALDWWVLGQSFGQLLSGTATDPNAGPLVVLLALTLFPLGTRSAGAPAGVAGAAPGAVGRWNPDLAAWVPTGVVLVPSTSRVPPMPIAASQH